MAKCKNCKKLDHILNCGISVGRWCVEKSDSPDIECERICDKYVPMTNADRIRNMADEELAEFLYRFNDIDEEVKFCINKKVCNDWLEKEDTIPDGWCKECLVKWLKSEAGCE